MVLIPRLVPSASSVAFWDSRWWEDLAIEHVRKIESGLVRNSSAEVIRKLLHKTFIGYIFDWFKSFPRWHKLSFFSVYVLIDKRLLLIMRSFYETSLQGPIDSCRSISADI